MKTYVIILIGMIFGIITLSHSALQVPHAQTTLTVFAAASLSDVFTALANDFEQEQDAIRVRFNFGGSSTLATQLSLGAQADLFASADRAQMARLVEASRVDEHMTTIFAETELALITPLDNPSGITSARDLMSTSVLLALGAPSVPIRTYSDQLINRLGMLYGSEFRLAIYDRVASEDLNVRQVLTRILLGEADAAIVYQSDLTDDVRDQVNVIALPSQATVTAHYVIAPLQDSAQPDAAQAFIEFVLSAAGQDILDHWHFDIPPQNGRDITDHETYARCVSLV